MRPRIKLRKLVGVILLLGGLPVPVEAVERLPPVPRTPAALANGPTETHAPRPARYPVRPASAVSLNQQTLGAKRPNGAGPYENIETPPLDMAPEAYANGTTVGDNGVYPIDLPTALMLADRANPEIGIARQGIAESLAVQVLARNILTPNLNAGTNLHIHNGPLQRSSGQILSLAEKSLYVGGGARTLAAESLKYPMIQISGALTDAIFEPLAARQRVAASRFHTGSTFNTILRDVSTGYIDLMAAEATLAILQESYANAVEVARTTANFAEVGQARQADADRTKTEATLLNSEVQMAIAERAVASAELCRLLNLDPSLRLTTVQGRPLPLPVLELVDPELFGRAAHWRRHAVASGPAGPHCRSPGNGGPLPSGANAARAAHRCRGIQCRYARRR